MLSRIYIKFIRIESVLTVINTDAYDVENNSFGWTRKYSSTLKILKTLKSVWQIMKPFLYKEP